MSFEKFRETVEKQRGILREMSSLSQIMRNTANKDEEKFIAAQINELKKTLKAEGRKGKELLNKINIPKVLESSKSIPSKVKEIKKTKHLKRKYKKIEMGVLEKATIKRIKKKEKKEEKKKEKKASRYVGVANRFFSGYANALVERGLFRNLEREITRANLQFILPSYVSIIFFTTLISVLAAVGIFLFFLFFNIEPTFPIIKLAQEGLGSRFLKVVWILIGVPIAVFFMTYFYPSIEKKSQENKINQELPFATIHMASISGSMVEPSKIFSILISTNEYPNLGKEFIKIMNEVNIYGYNLVSSLRSVAFNSPSRKLAELLNSLATTITSGGELTKFFEKRSDSLLFEHRLEQEKSTKAAETFMDIYISVVIAAPMILMLLLMMMKISGLGIPLSTGMITLVMVAGVSIINVFFLIFLHMRKSGE